jgi:type II secretory pathway pseudopilin PulG
MKNAHTPPIILSAAGAVSRATPHRRHGQRGISLLEIIAALAIIAIIIIGALALVGQADTSAKSSELLKGITGLQANVKSLYNGQQGYKYGNITDLLISAKAAPSNWVRGNKLQHGYGGEVVVDAFDTYFTMTVRHVAKEACIRVISEQAGTNWASITVNGGGSINARSMTVADAVSMCGQGDYSDIVLTSAD